MVYIWKIILLLYQLNQEIIMSVKRGNDAADDNEDDDTDDDDVVEKEREWERERERKVFYQKLLHTNQKVIKHSTYQSLSEY